MAIADPEIEYVDVSIPTAIHVTLPSTLGNGKRAFFTGTGDLGNLADFFTTGIGLAKEDQPICTGFIVEAASHSRSHDFILDV
jgi:hypothetical protein